MIKLETILKQYREIKNKYGQYSSLHEAYAVLKEEIDEIWDIVKQKPESRNHKELEKEILANGWLTVPADLGVMFDTPVEERFDAAMKLLGFDPLMLASVAGHA